MLFGKLLKNQGKDFYTNLKTGIVGIGKAASSFFVGHKYHKYIEHATAIAPSIIDTHDIKQLIKY